MQQYYTLMWLRATLAWAVLCTVLIALMVIADIANRRALLCAPVPTRFEPER